MRLLREQSSEKVFAKYRSLPEAVKASLWFTICSILQKEYHYNRPDFHKNARDRRIWYYFAVWSMAKYPDHFATLNLSNQIFNNGMVKYEKTRMDIPLQCLDCLILQQFWYLCFILFSIHLWIGYLNCR